MQLHLHDDLACTSVCMLSRVDNDNCTIDACDDLACTSVCMLSRVDNDNCTIDAYTRNCIGIDIFVDLQAQTHTDAYTIRLIHIYI